LAGLLDLDEVVGHFTLVGEDASITNSIEYI
jgi:hypothetical protein